MYETVPLLAGSPLPAKKYTVYVPAGCCATVATEKLPLVLEVEAASAPFLGGLNLTGSVLPLNGLPAYIASVPRIVVCVVHVALRVPVPLLVKVYQ